MEVQNIEPAAVNAAANFDPKISEPAVISDAKVAGSTLEAPDKNMGGAITLSTDGGDAAPEDEGVEEIIERPYTLRKLKDKDLFPMLQILKKIGIREFKDAFIQVTSGEKTIKDVGILAALDMVDILISNIGNVENEIYALWSDISGISIDDMKEMEFGTLPLMISDTFSNMKDAAFFKVLSKLL